MKLELSFFNNLLMELNISLKILCPYIFTILSKFVSSFKSGKKSYLKM